jgi:hypothetical protein
MSKPRDVVVVRVSDKGDREDEGSYVKFLLGGRVARGHRSPSRMRLRGSLRSALTGHP